MLRASVLVAFIAAGCGGSSNTVVADPVDVPPPPTDDGAADPTPIDRVGLLATVESGTIVLAGALTDAMHDVAAAALEGQRYVRVGMTYRPEGSSGELVAAIDTEGEIDQSDVASDDTGTMYADHSVTIFLMDEELGVSLSSAVATACGARDFYDESAVLRAGQLIEDGYEQLNLVMRPNEALIEWGADQGHEVIVAASIDDSRPPPGGTWRIRVYDGRPEGVAVVCDREVE